MLETIPASVRSGLIFGGWNGELCDASLAKVMKVNKVVGPTVHGFRSSFRDWAGDCTGFARETMEEALSHRVDPDGRMGRLLHWPSRSGYPVTNESIMTPDPDKAALLMKLIEGLEIDSADGRAGVRAILREIEAAAPGSVEVMAAVRAHRFALAEA